MSLLSEVCLNTQFHIPILEYFVYTQNAKKKLQPLPSGGRILQIV